MIHLRASTKFSFTTITIITRFTILFDELSITEIQSEISINEFDPHKKEFILIVSLLPVSERGYSLNAKGSLESVSE